MSLSGALPTTAVDTVSKFTRQRLELREAGNMIKKRSSKPFASIANRWLAEHTEVFWI